MLPDPQPTLWRRRRIAQQKAPSTPMHLATEWHSASSNSNICSSVASSALSSSKHCTASTPIHTSTLHVAFSLVFSLRRHRPIQSKPSQTTKQPVCRSRGGLAPPQPRAQNHITTASIRAYAEGRERMMSLSPGSMMLITQVLKSLPQAVPSSTLLPLKWCTLVLASMA